MKKRIIATVMIIVLAMGILGGCGKNAGEAGASGKDAASSAAKGFKGLPEVGTVQGEVNQQKYPLSEEKITLRLWAPIAESLGTISDPNDGEFWQWYEELTNVHVEFIMPAVGTEKDTFQLLFASDNMPDIVMAYADSCTYKRGEDAAIEDGYFVNICDHYDCCPNYVSWLKANEGTGKSAFTDAGNLYGFWGITKTMGENITTDRGLCIRQDFLEKVGMDIPKTYDEWTAVMKAFKEELGIEAPFYTSYKGVDYGEFMAGFGTAPKFYQKDGKVHYGPMDDEYLEYLKFMRDWYVKGYLDQDFSTRQSYGVAADNDMQLNDKIGSLIDFGSRLSDTYVKRGASNPDFFLVPCEQPKKSADAPDPQYRKPSAGEDHLSGTVWTISADSKYKEIAMKWVDGFYARDIYLNANYGIDSEKYVVWRLADDGDPYHRILIYDFRYSNPNGLDSATVLTKYWTKNPPLKLEGASIEQADANKQSGYKLWSKYPAVAYIPDRITQTTEEESELAGLFTDIETYVEECNVKFLLGQMSLDDYDSFRKTLKDMGIERCIELKQAALDRYNAR
ncbi:MAG: extracellular solute-binding protein [Lachnospiraceae bacterium]|nr:extracellular solute-binding protein [Lachnospiraceae bacterium]